MFCSSVKMEFEEEDGLRARGAPQLIVADDEKLLVEEMVDGQTIMTER